MPQITDAVIYTRTACMDGSDMPNGDQVQTCTSCADRKRLRIARIYSDAGSSGGTITRPGLAELLEDAQRVPTPFAVVLIRDTSRLGRNLADVLRVVSLLKSYGVSVYFVDEALDSSSPHFSSLLVMLGGCQYFESLSKADRRGKAACAVNGFVPGGRPVPGYDHVPVVDSNVTVDVDGRSKVIRAVINPAEAMLVRRIFDLRATGRSYGRIARLLNVESVPVPNAKVGNDLRKWTSDQIRAIVNNDQYVGRVWYRRTRRYRNPISGKNENRPLLKSEWQVRDAPELRIVSDDQWRKAHKNPKRHGKGRRHA